MADPRYHHGNLRAALLDAGFALARAGGPLRLQVRELAAAESVSPSAVYRHFPDLAHLRADVARLAREALAREMQTAADAIPSDLVAGERAIRRFQAIGAAYLAFAAREPQLFDTAFMATEAPPSCEDAPSAWEVLLDALQQLVATGEMAPARLADAPLIAWSSVHGAASMLAGNLLPADVPDGVVRAAVLDGVLRALGVRTPAPPA